MFVSVIIPTYNRSHLILSILDALELQTFKDFEVVISNDGSTDDTVQVIKDNQGKYNFDINILDNKNGGRSIARNKGVRNAKGDLLVFFDDDVRPNSNCIQLHVDFHEKHPNSLLDGPALYDLEVVKTKGDFQWYRSNLEMGWYVKGNHPVKKERAGLVGANKSMSRALFWEVGGFDEQLTDSEDFEFAFRAMHHCNYDIYFDYRTWVYHDDYKSFQLYLKRRLEANGSSKRLIQLFPEILEHYSSKFIFKPNKWKQPFFNIFKASFFRKLPETTFFLNFLPQKIRYKLYDIIITANTLYN
ncbi:MAG: glycosyltransferase involved in cell wall biosynthesis [Aureispira sp.]|jgi:glycosyltransferase involved in cell wall biosynthesis